MTDETEEKLRLKFKKEECQRLIALVEDIADFKRWGFRRSFVDETIPRVIFDSEWCRVKFVSSGLSGHIYDSISIDYGRLHASDDSTILPWNGRLCHCWHRINEALNFLDGLSPHEAANRTGWSRVMDQFRQSELGISLRYRQPEWLLRMHISVWEHYGNRLFDLFDLRRPDLWEQYTQFIKEFYSIQNSTSDTTPPQDQVC